MNPTNPTTDQRSTRPTTDHEDAADLLDGPTTAPPVVVPGSFQDRSGDWLQRTSLIGTWLRFGLPVAVLLAAGYLLARSGVLPL